MSLSFPSFVSQAGLLASTSPLTPRTRVPFPLCLLPVFFPHVTCGAGPRLGRGLLGSFRPSTPAGPGLRGTFPRPFALPAAACRLWALAPDTPCGGDVPFPGFNRYLAGPWRPPGGTGLWAAEAAPRRPRGCCLIPGREPLE